ncbi:MAG: HAD-IA family hydrolase [Kordiimonadaceae bacterium]|nr:HAD-IA family hydrolase [Kordiimonadaceae bacterium]
MAATKLVIFDCDGTLVDSQHIILAAMREAFINAGHTPLDDADVRSSVGLSPYEAVARLLPDENEEYHNKMAEDFRLAYYRQRTECSPGPDPLYEGTKETLLALNDAGYMLGVATGNSQRGLQRVIDDHGLQGLFVTLQTADGHISKPDPSMVYTAVAEAGSDVANSIMIGDTSYDMQMATRAGCHALGVSWGYHSDAELSAAGAVHIARSYAELPAVIERLIGKP